MGKGIWQYSSKVIVALLIGISYAQCSQKHEASIDKYFNVQHFLNKQVEILQAEENQLIKTLTIGAETETSTINSLDSVQWEAEFKLFREHDINKPVLVDAYFIEDINTPNGHKLTVYTLKDTTQLGILKSVFDFNPDGQVYNWASSFSEHNILYSNLREVSMNFSQDGQRMRGFTVKGYHKLIFNDTVFYQLQAEIQYAN